MTAFTAGFILSFACWAESASALSIKEKEIVRNTLYSLLESEESLELEEKKEGQGSTQYSNTVDPRWQRVLNVKHNSYVKTLFQDEPRLQEWIKKSSEPFFLAIQVGNLKMIRFFADEKGMINAARMSTLFSPLHFSIITGQMDIIKFFLDHPKTDLRQTSVWGENIFHFVFLSSALTAKDALQLLNLLFQPKYFSKISDLLNDSNDYNETPLDFYLKNKAANTRTGRPPNKESKKKRKAPPEDKIKILIEDTLEKLSKQKTKSSKETEPSPKNRGAVHFKTGVLKAEFLENLENKKEQTTETPACAGNFSSDSI